MQYLLVVPVAFYRAPDGRIACESAFVEHLRMSRKLYEPQFTSMRIAAPAMSDADYEKNKDHLGHFNEEEAQIFYTQLHPFWCNRLLFALVLWIPTYLKIIGAVRKADLVHSGLSFDILMPFEIFSLFAGAVMGKKTVFVIDIDNRTSADMLYATGAMSKKSYFISKRIYNPLRILQIKWAVRFCSLLMLKSQSLVDDYGKGKSHVKNFYDVAFSPEYLIPEARLQQKIQDVQDMERSLDLTFFGRLVPYKGIDCCIRAVKAAREMGATGARLHILGAGAQEDELKALSAELNTQEYVIFYGAVPFGPAFFNQLYDYHLLMAAPLSQDTPRSLFDAMAAGIPLLAYDTDYYKDLVNTGAVDVVPWRSEEALAEKIVAFHKDRALLAKRIAAGVTFAKENSQDIWMERRHGWILDLFRE